MKSLKILGLAGILGMGLLTGCGRPREVYDTPKPAQQPPSVVEQVKPKTHEAKNEPMRSEQLAKEYVVSYTKYADPEPYAIDKTMKTIRGIVSEEELESLKYMNTHNYIGDLKYHEFKRSIEKNENK